MRLLGTFTHEEVKAFEKPKVFKRFAARGIVVDGDDILLIYTKRYNDYSIPGGGMNANEDAIESLLRELSEETGARSVEVIKPFGLYEDVRPHPYDEYDIMHMTSYFYICKADRTLGEASPEDYEVKNGSVPVWVNIHEAIKHNEDVIKNKEKSMGFSIIRETEVLRLIANELVG